MNMIHNIFISDLKQFIKKKLSTTEIRVMFNKLNIILLILVFNLLVVMNLKSRYNFLITQLTAKIPPTM